VLDTYQTERKPHARRMITLALVIGHAMTAGGGIGNALRRVVAPRARRVPGLAARVLDSKTPPLSGSALIHRHRGPKQLAGSLCPNAVTAAGARLDTVLGTGFAIVTSVLPTEGEKDLIEQRNAVVHYAGPGTELAEWLNRGAVRAAIVRPDFTVMRADRDLSRLCEALPTLNLRRARIDEAAPGGSSL
jgi:3-(3-hydroxy-phenyl)propionate hydroxylase